PPFPKVTCPTAAGFASAQSVKVAPLFLPWNRGIYLSGLLVPAVEARQVARIPCLAESRRAQIPVRADLARRGAQIMPEVCDRRAAPKPVAVVDAVDHKAWLQHERVRDHRVVGVICVLLDVEVFL